MNYARTALLLAAMTALFMVVGYGLGGQGGMTVALAFSVVSNVVAYWFSDRMALASVGARQVDAASSPELVGMVETLARRAGLPTPRVYVVDSEQPNAFATGRNPANAAVAVNAGLLRTLAPDELAGVLAHELAHIKNRDTLTMTIAATLGGAISSIAHIGLWTGGSRREGGLGPIGAVALAILAPMAAMIVQMAVSRSREYVADHDGALIAGDPMGLAQALAKISHGAALIPDATLENRPAMAHLFIVNPLNGSGMDNLFSTHPNVENRIAALQRLAAEIGPASGAGRPGASGAWRPMATRDTPARNDSDANAPSRGPWG
jgi:heat shock protein HtpX